MIDKEILIRAKHRKGGKLLPVLLNILGTFMLLAAIASCVPILVPQIMGYEIYHVLTGSMEPEIPVGSILYVEKVAPENIVTDDVIAFHGADGIITHRVVENHVVEGELTTKGDANAGEDLSAVDYEAVIGRVAKHYPMIGAIMDLYTSAVGKVYLILFAASGAMMNVLAGRIRDHRNMKRKMEIETEMLR